MFWKHQENAIARFKEEEIVGLLFDCGTGKTRTAIGIIDEKIKKGDIDSVVLIVPKILMRQWEEELKNTVSQI